jgi:hypothetical protein
LKNRFWKRAGMSIGGLILCILAVVYVTTYTGTNIYPNKGKQHALLRLEDVGPGGEYGNLEGLGKLRAVLDYVSSEQIPYHIAVIPRMISLETGIVWQERGIDDPKPDSITTSMIGLLQEAQRRGAVLGMHGYSHQYGDSLRPDNSHNSGTGAEFNIPGAPETMQPAFAAERISRSLAAFDRAGLTPSFWESPHYKDTRDQEKVFRSYMGLLYQPDLFSLRSFKDLTAYESTNTYGKSTLGSIYIPAPFKYVSDAASVDRILAKAADDNGLASMYFHPFLEFPFLKPVTDQDGKPVMKDLLPLYAYQEGTPSHLHRLVNGMRLTGYKWRSLFDIVPFSPAHQVALPTATPYPNVLLGDVAGEGHADVVIREKHRILVIPGQYTWPRNRAQEASEVWLKEAFAPEEQTLLVDLNHDGRDDLLAYHSLTGAVRVAWNDIDHFVAPVLAGTLPQGLASLQSYRFIEGNGILARAEHGIVLARYKDQQLHTTVAPVQLPQDAELFAAKLEQRNEDDIMIHSASEQTMSVLTLAEDQQYTKPKLLEGIQIPPGTQVVVGDFNGDGRDDLLLYAAATGLWKVYENEGNGAFRALDNDFGPWARGQGRIAAVADYDGNGKTDIASYDPQEYVLDLALSFRGRTP